MESLSAGSDVSSPPDNSLRPAPHYFIIRFIFAPATGDEAAAVLRWKNSFSLTYGLSLDIRWIFLLSLISQAASSDSLMLSRV